MILDANNRTPANINKCHAAKIYFDGVLQKDSVVRCNDLTGDAWVYCKTITGAYATTGFRNTKKVLVKRIKTNIVIVLPEGVDDGPYRTPDHE